MVANGKGRADVALPDMVDLDIRVPFQGEEVVIENAIQCIPIILVRGII